MGLTIAVTTVGGAITVVVLSVAARQLIGFAAWAKADTVRRATKTLRAVAIGRALDTQVSKLVADFASAQARIA